VIPNAQPGLKIRDGGHVDHRLYPVITRMIRGRIKRLERVSHTGTPEIHIPQVT